MDEQQKPEQPPAEHPIPTEPAPAITQTEVSEMRKKHQNEVRISEHARQSEIDDIPKEVQQEPQQIAAPIASTQVYVPRKTEAAEAKPSRWQKFRDFATECTRVLRVTKKPDRMEFKTIVKISGIGMAIIGFLGFFVHFVKELFF